MFTHNHQCLSIKYYKVKLIKFCKATSFFNHFIPLVFIITGYWTRSVAIVIFQFPLLHYLPFKYRYIRNITYHLSCQSGVYKKEYKWKNENPCPAISQTTRKFDILCNINKRFCTEHNKIDSIIIYKSVGYLHAHLYHQKHHTQHQHWLKFQEFTLYMISFHIYESQNAIYHIR